MLGRRQLTGRNFEGQLRTEKFLSCNRGKSSSSSRAFNFISYNAFIFTCHWPLVVYSSVRRPCLCTRIKLHYVADESFGV
jgi:hypothetical protein